MFIKVKVKPHAREQNVEKIPDELFSEKKYNGLYYVKLKESAEGGAANIELIKVLKKYFKKEVKIKSGYNSRNKIVEVME